MCSPMLLVVVLIYCLARFNMLLHLEFSGLGQFQM